MIVKLKWLWSLWSVPWKVLILSYEAMSTFSIRFFSGLYSSKIQSSPIQGFERKVLILIIEYFSVNLLKSSIFGFNPFILFFERDWFCSGQTKSKFMAWKALDFLTKQLWKWNSELWLCKKLGWCHFVVPKCLSLYCAFENLKENFTFEVMRGGH